MTLFAQADMGTIEAATKLFGPMGAVCVVLCGALVYVFRLYREETRARIEDARAGMKMLEQLAPYLARLARRIERLSRAPGTGEDSDHPPPISRARISDVEDDR